MLCIFYFNKYIISNNNKTDNKNITENSKANDTSSLEQTKYL